MFGSTPLQPNPYPTRRSPIMRQERIIQASLFDIFATHEIGRELKQISQWLDQHRPLLRLGSNDLRRDGVRETGRRGLPAEAVLRCALLKQYRQLNYEELAFHLEDSASFRAFARLPMGWTPQKAVLQKSAQSLRPVGKRSTRRWCATPGKPGSSRRRWFASTARSLKR